MRAISVRERTVGNNRKAFSVSLGAYPQALAHARASEKIKKEEEVAVQTLPLLFKRKFCFSF